MRSLDILAYAVSHHSFEQAACLSAEFDHYRLATFAYIDPGLVEWVEKTSPGLARLLAKRSHPRLPSRYVMDYPSEQLRQVLCRISGKPFSYFHAHDRMAERLVSRLAPPRNLICVDTGAEKLFRAWAGQTNRILDLTIALPQSSVKIYDRARKDAGVTNLEFPDANGWVSERYAAEIEMADKILCPSDFVRQSCLDSGVPEEKCQLIPYGFDPGIFSPDQEWKISGGSMRCVFVGTFCLRKGSHILTSIFPELRKRFPGLELHVYGQVLDPPSNPVPGMIFHGHVNQKQLARELRKMHLMIFPTYLEGSAYAVYQALASGVPVLTTKNCGSVVDDSCGRVLDFPDKEAFMQAASDALGEPECLQSWHENAPKCVSQYSWHAYGQKIIKFMKYQLKQTE